MHMCVLVIFLWALLIHVYIHIQSQWLFLPEMVSTAAKFLLATTKTDNWVSSYLCIFLFHTPPQYVCVFCLHFQAHLHKLFHICFSSAYSSRRLWTEPSMCRFLLIIILGTSEESVLCACLLCIQFSILFNMYIVLPVPCPLDQTALYVLLILQ
jgi:hypothetical protein